MTCSKIARDLLDCGYPDPELVGRPAAGNVGVVVPELVLPTLLAINAAPFSSLSERDNRVLFLPGTEFSKDSLSLTPCFLPGFATPFSESGLLVTLSRFGVICPLLANCSSSFLYNRMLPN